jgi:hypothetical protein
MIRVVFFMGALHGTEKMAALGIVTITRDVTSGLRIGATVCPLRVKN